MKKMRHKRPVIYIEKLEIEARKYGYKVCYTNTNIPYVNHTIKAIFMYQHLKGNREFLLAHEIGHCYWERFRLLNAKIIEYKSKKLLQESLAWVAAYFICKKCGIQTKGFIKECLRCLKTYV